MPKKPLPKKKKVVPRKPVRKAEPSAKRVELEGYYGKLDSVVKIKTMENIFELSTKGGQTIRTRNLVFVHHAKASLLEAYGKLYFLECAIPDLP